MVIEVVCGAEVMVILKVGMFQIVCISQKGVKCV